MTKKKFAAYANSQGYEARYSGQKKRFFLKKARLNAGDFVTPGEGGGFAFSFDNMEKL